MLRLRPIHVTSALTLAGAAAFTASFVQSPDAARADRSFEFTISADRVVPATDFAAKVSVLGSAITDNGVDMPVTMAVQIGGVSHDLFGPSLDPVYGNLNDHGPARHVIIDRVFTVGDAIDVAASSWETDRSARSMTVTTTSPSPQVHVLRNGDAVPNIAGFDGQADVATYLAAYIDGSDNTIALDDDQIIYLFELGTTDLSDAAADFQDLVVLITLGDTPEDLRRRDLADIAAYD